MPITIAGSLAVLIKSLVIAARDHLGWETFAYLMQPLVSISNLVWRGTFSLYAFFFALALGYQLAKAFEGNRLAAAIVSLSSFALSIANVAQIKFHGDNIAVKKMPLILVSFRQLVCLRLFYLVRLVLQFIYLL